MGSFVNRKWQKVKAPASWANTQYHPKNLNHQVQFDENAVGLVLVSEAGESIGAVIDGAFKDAISIVCANPDIIALDEFVMTDVVDETGEEE